MIKQNIVLVSADNMQSHELLIACEFNESHGISSENGEPLHLIASFSLEKIATILGVALPAHLLNSKKRLYFFSYFDQDEYFLDRISYDGTNDETEFFTEAYTRGIVADEGAFTFTGEAVFTIKATDQDSDDEVSFIGGEAEFLQNEDYTELEDYDFIGQVSGYDLPEELEELFYFTANIGYFYIKKDFSEGLFFVQGT